MNTIGFVATRRVAAAVALILLGSCGGGGGYGGGGGGGGAPSVTTTSLPDGTAGVAYSQTLHYTGGSGTATWTVSSGTLPAGLSLSTAGVISGTPAGPDGTSAFTVSITDYNGHGTQPLSITVSGTPGGLMKTFGTNGVVNAPPTTGYNNINAIISDGAAIYLAGADEPSSGSGDHEWRIEKRDAGTGALVGAFGTGGAITENPTAGADRIEALATDGTNLYVAGFDSTDGGQWRIEKRLLSDGSLVAAFGTSGVVTSDPSTGEDEALAIVYDNGAIFIGGYDSSPSTPEWRIEKRDATTGALVGAFGTSGVVLETSTSGLVTSAFSDGASLYAAGKSGTAAQVEKRGLASGALDSGFGSSGVKTLGTGALESLAVTGESGGTASLYVATQKDTSSVITGTHRSWQSDRVALSDGSTTWSQVMAPASVSTVPESATLDGSLLYVCGAAGLSTLRVERRAVADGSFDSTFGPGGFVSETFSSASLFSNDRAYVLALDSSGFYVTGTGWRIEKRRK